MITKHRGLSLVELLVGLTVGLVLMAGVVQMFVGAKQSYNVQEGLARVQESGRIATELMSAEVRKLGYMGCMSMKEGAEKFLLVSLKDQDKFRYSYAPEELLQGYEIDNGGEIEGVDALPGTDAIVVKVPVGHGMYVQGDGLDANGFQVNYLRKEEDACTINKQSYDMVNGICPRDIMMLSNCNRAVVFQATALSVVGNSAVRIEHGEGAKPGNAVTVWAPADQEGGSVEGGRFNGAVVKGMEVITYRTLTYYIGTSTRTGRPGLFVRVNEDTPQELAEDVQSMALSYGEDKDDDDRVDEYEAADDVDDWGKVQAIRIQLLVQSSQPGVLPEEQVLEFRGDKVDTSDKRLRQVFSSTVALRNRVPN